jgi:hypothetical protein
MTARHLIDIAATLLLGLACVAATGCASRPDVGIDTTGSVRLDGTPLEMGMVVFAPADGGESRSGTVQTDGTFCLYAIKPGRYRVGVQTSMFAGMAAAADKARAAGDSRPFSMREVKGTFRAVAKKVEDPQTSGLELDVQPGAALVIDLSSK